MGEDESTRKKRWHVVHKYEAGSKREAKQDKTQHVSVSKRSHVLAYIELGQKGFDQPMTGK
jgi:hypothetical protein